MQAGNTWAEGSEGGVQSSNVLPDVVGTYAQDGQQRVRAAFPWSGARASRSIWMAGGRLVFVVIDDEVTGGSAKPGGT